METKTITLEIKKTRFINAAVVVDVTVGRDYFYIEGLDPETISLPRDKEKLEFLTDAIDRLSKEYFT